MELESHRTGSRRRFRRNKRRRYFNGKISAAACETSVRGYKFAWRILLISNLALGAYIFTRPRKHESTKKAKKHTEILSALDIPDPEKPDVTPSHEPEPESTPESHW